jgi:hypothetical protein
MLGEAPLRRVTLEAAVIVGSILAAFTIQAWWDDRMEGEEEQRLLGSLLEESQVTLQQIEENMSFHEAIMASADALLAAPLSQTASFSADSLDRLIEDLTWARSADYQTATLNTILLGGRLAVIDDAETRDRITQWRGALDEIADVATQDWGPAVERVREYVRKHGSMAQLYNVSDGTPGLGSRAPVAQTPLPMGAQDHFELLRRTEFRSIVLERRWAQEDVLDQTQGYPYVRAALIRLIESLEQEIEESRGASRDQL